MVKTYVGGQALIEGVMMKYKDRIGIAVRQPNKKITVKKEKLRFKETNIPFLRGIFNLIIILYIGIKSINYSADVSVGKDEKIGFFSILLSFILAIAFAIVLFKLIPLAITSFLDRFLHVNNILFNIIDGVLKISIFILYVYLISLMKDIYRVFEYHGAEHKTVACYEAGKKLIPKEIQKFKKEHPRCGTSFIFLVLIISIIVYTFIPKDYSFTLKLLLRVLLLPVIASLSYEVLRIGARFKFFKFISYPGLWMQKLTTKEPDDKQIEVAVRALKAAVGR